MNIITRLINKIKKQIVRPRPVEGRVKNTPWRGKRQGSRGAGEQRGRGASLSETRSILWMVGGYCRVLEVANG